MNSSRASSVRPAVWILAVCVSLLGASVQAVPLQDDTIRVDVGLLQVVVTVTDRQDNYVTKLTADDFTVEVDGKPRKIEHFALGTDTPVSLGILVDTSSSMKDRLPAARQAATAFIKGMRPQDEFFLMTFGRGTKTVQELTTDRSKLESALQKDWGTGVTTHLFNAVEDAAKKLRKAKHKKRAVIVISDGGDVSRANFNKFKNGLSQTEVLMYTIETESPGRSFVQRMFEPSSGVRARNMQAIAEETGARWFRVDARDSKDKLSRQFEDAFAIVSAELRGQYSIGVYSTGAKAPNRVRVRTVNPDYKARTRRDE